MDAGQPAFAGYAQALVRPAAAWRAGEISRSSDEGASGVSEGIGRGPEDAGRSALAW